MFLVDILCYWGLTNQHYACTTYNFTYISVELSAKETTFTVTKTSESENGYPPCTSTANVKLDNNKCK